MYPPGEELLSTFGEKDSKAKVKRIGDSITGISQGGHSLTKGSMTLMNRSNTIYALLQFKRDSHWL